MAASAESDETEELLEASPFAGADGTRFNGATSEAWRSRAGREVAGAVDWACRLVAASAAAKVKAAVQATRVVRRRFALALVRIIVCIVL